MTRNIKQIQTIKSDLDSIKTNETNEDYQKEMVEGLQKNIKKLTDFVINFNNFLKLLEKELKKK